MKQITKHHTHNRSNDRQQDILSVYIRGNLSVVESQNLQGCKLSLTLGDVDIVQIVQYHKCQHSGRYDQYHDDQIQASQHVIQPSFNTAGITYIQYSIHRQKLCSDLLDLIILSVLYTVDDRVIFCRYTI